MKLSKIITLSNDLINKIAAGEVIERPASVVKELVENSIDAGATNIKVELKEWWIEEIIVIENWEWIEKDDLKIITQKYTTSKIKSLDDLYNVMTFGFRWEALSTISEVSKLYADKKVSIPIYWMSQSLNVSVANAVMLYEAQRQRKIAWMYDKSSLPEKIIQQTLNKWLSY